MGTLFYGLHVKIVGFSTPRPLQAAGTRFLFSHSILEGDPEVHGVGGEVDHDVDQRQALAEAQGLHEKHLRRQVKLLNLAKMSPSSYLDLLF